MQETKHNRKNETQRKTKHSRKKKRNTTEEIS